MDKADFDELLTRSVRQAKSGNTVAIPAKTMVAILIHLQELEYCLQDGDTWGERFWTLQSPANQEDDEQDDEDKSDDPDPATVVRHGDATEHSQHQHDDEE